MAISAVEKIMAKRITKRIVCASIFFLYAISISHAVPPTSKICNAGVCFATKKAQDDYAFENSCIFPLKSSSNIASSLSNIQTPTETPQTVDLSALQSKFNELWSDSFPDRKSQEQGGTFFTDDKGRISILNIGSGDSGTFMPNYSSPAAGYQKVGMFHTHPYDESEGGYTGVSFSGADVAAQILDKNNVSIVQSGDEQFMLLRTSASPSVVDYEALKAQGNQRVAVLMGEGKSFSEASKISTVEFAKEYNLAYYEGKNGVFNRIYP